MYFWATDPCNSGLLPTALLGRCPLYFWSTAPMYFWAAAPCTSGPVSPVFQSRCPHVILGH